jgi:cell division protein FtsQ
MTGTLQRSAARAVSPVPHRGMRAPVLAGLAAMVALVLVWVVAFSSLLGARTVTVRGEHSLSVQQIRAAAAISSGTPLIRLDTGAVRHRVDALPQVASARVSVSYPSTVVITVIERVPVGYLASADGFVLVDASGAQYQTIAVAPKSLPRFGLPAGAQARATGQAVATVAAALTPSIRAELSEITATTPDSISLTLRDGRSVRWGSDLRSQDKARLLPALLTQRGTVFDVSNPDLVVVR